MTCGRAYAERRRSHTAEKIQGVLHEIGGCRNCKLVLNYITPEFTVVHWLSINCSKTLGGFLS